MKRVFHTGGHRLERPEEDITTRSCEKELIEDRYNRFDEKHLTYPKTITFCYGN
jgi:hypothetical protein